MTWTVGASLYDTGPAPVLCLVATGLTSQQMQQAMADLQPLAVPDPTRVPDRVVRVWNASGCSVEEILSAANNWLDGVHIDYV